MVLYLLTCWIPDRAGPGSSPDRDHCIVILILYFHSISSHTNVLTDHSLHAIETRDKHLPDWPRKAESRPFFNNKVLTLHYV